MCSITSKQVPQAIQQDRKRAEENLLKASTAKFFRQVSFGLTRSDNFVIPKDANNQLIQSDSNFCNTLKHEFSRNFSPPSMIAVNIDSTENSACFKST